MSKNLLLNVSLSVVIIAKNEEKNIVDCLESVSGWADEIIVVDDESTDRTAKIAEEMGARVLRRKMDIEGRHRNWAYSQAKNDWVLSLDADEIVTEELKKEISEVLKDNPSYVGFSIPLRNYIGNYWVRYGGWYPAGKVRLFRKTKIRYEEAKVHPRVFIDGRCGHLTKDIVHKGYPDIAHFLDSLNRQSSWEAEKWVDTSRQMSLFRIIWRSIDRFFRRYIRKRGYKDGLYGFVVAFFDSLYQVISYLKYKELLRTAKDNLTD
ncbi:MAG: glycosyltransferase family 2 protein [Candidatus Omnitrophica bacterium]|nr:glycosyltransferase family 2 protein [Candidatus Omnitrophota bacterium]